MSLKDYSREEITSLSMLELASLVLKEEKKALNFQEIFDRIAELKGFTKEQKEEYIAQFYTDLNVDGRFTTLGSNIWGLKRWYPIEQADEEVHTPKKKKTTKKRKKVVEDEFEEEEDLLLDEDLDEEFDDEDLDEEELDEDLEELDDEDDLEKDDLDEDLDKDLEEFEDFDEDEEDIDEEFEDEEFDDEKEDEDK